MAELLTLAPKIDYRKLAVEKIAEELKSFKGDRYGEAVKNHVASTLTHFCEENERFAEVVYKTKRTLSDCCAEIMKGCGSCISDIDVYRGAVRNYFPNADVTFHMTIAINGDAPTEEELNELKELCAGIYDKKVPVIVDDIGEEATKAWFELMGAEYTW